MNTQTSKPLVRYPRFCVRKDSDAANQRWLPSRRVDGAFVCLAKHPAASFQFRPPWPDWFFVDGEKIRVKHAPEYVVTLVCCNNIKIERRYKNAECTLPYGGTR